MLACQQKCKTRAVSLTNHPWENLLRCTAIHPWKTYCAVRQSPRRPREPFSSGRRCKHRYTASSAAARADEHCFSTCLIISGRWLAGRWLAALAHQGSLAGGRWLAARWEKLLRCKAIAKAASGTIQLRSPLQAPLCVPHHQRALAGRRWLINGRWLAGVGLLPGCCPAGPSPQPQPAPARAALPRAS